jgi:hypothetical protein
VYDPRWPGPPEIYAPAPRRGHRGLVAALILVAVLVVGAVGTGGYLLLGSGGTRPARTTMGSGRLQSPFRLQPVTAENPAPCTAGQLPDTDGRTCYTLGSGMTVSEVRGLRVQPPDPNSGQLPVLSVSLRSADAVLFTNLTQQAYQAYAADPTTPRAKIAIVILGQVAAAPQISTGPITGGDFMIYSGQSQRGLAQLLFHRLTGA